MYTTLENESLRLREDVVSDGNRRHVLCHGTLEKEVVAELANCRAVTVQNWH